MGQQRSQIGRRQFLRASVATIGVGALRLRAAVGGVVEVAYAGSMTSVMEGGIKPAVAQELGLELRGRAQGASALAQEIVGGAVRPDVFIAVTPGPMRVVLAAGKAAAAEPIAATEMVIAYAPRSRFAAALAAAGRPGAPDWWQVLQTPGLRFGRTDPRTDPQGRNIIFTVQLAERYYRQPGLAQRILGDTLNPQQIFAEAMVEGRLQSGELDAASAYRTQPGPFHLPYVALPAAINLSQASAGGEIKLTLRGKSYRPEPLVFYAAALRGAAHAGAAQRLVSWLHGPSAQRVLRQFDYDAAGAAEALTA